MERKKGMMAAFAAGLLWGSTSPIAQFLFDNKGVDSKWLVPYRLLASGALLFLYAVVIKKQKPVEVWKTGEDAVRTIAFGILGVMGMQFSFFSAIQETNAGVATIFQYLNPAMLLIYFAIIYQVMPKKKEMIAVLFSISGIFLVATHGNFHSLSISPKGIIFGLLLAVSTCFYGVLPGPLLKKYPAEIISAWSMLIGGSVLFFVFRPWKMAVEIDAEIVVAFLGIVIPGTILPFCFYLAAVKYAGSVYAGLLSSVEPVAATIVAAVCLGTAFPPIDILGFAMVLATLFILSVNSM